MHLNKDLVVLKIDSHKYGTTSAQPPSKRQQLNRPSTTQNLLTVGYPMTQLHQKEDEYDASGQYTGERLQTDEQHMKKAPHVYQKPYGVTTEEFTSATSSKFQAAFMRSSSTTPSGSAGIFVRPETAQMSITEGREETN